MPELSSEKMSRGEVALTVALPTLATGAILHTFDSNSYDIDIPLIKDVPYIDHSTSMFGGYFVGYMTDSAAERIAIAAENRDMPNAARRIRKLGGVAAMATSIAAQVAVETNQNFGYGDKYDVLAGVIATVPGIVHSRLLTKRVKKLRERQRLVESM